MIEKDALKSDMGTKYWAEVSYRRCSTIHVIVKVVYVMRSAKWRIMWRSPVGSRVVWKALPQVFDTEKAAQAALDAKAKALGLQPVDLDRAVGA